MRLSNVIRAVVMTFGLYGVVLGVSAFLAGMVAMVVGAILRTDSSGVFIWIGIPLTFIFATFWTVKNWSFVKILIRGEGH